MSRIYNTRRKTNTGDQIIDPMEKRLQQLEDTVIKVFSINPEHRNKKNTSSIFQTFGLIFWNTYGITIAPILTVLKLLRSN
jgi:hypothetical protein